MVKQMTKVSKWHAMNSCKDIAKEWEAFEEAKSALVEAIRANYGEDAPVSFKTYSFGEIENAKPAAKVATAAPMAITPELMAQFAAFLEAKGAKVKRK